MSGPAAVFEQHRRRLLRLAYRMLGTMGDAEDVVQDACSGSHFGLSVRRFLPPTGEGQKPAPFPPKSGHRWIFLGQLNRVELCVRFHRADFESVKSPEAWLVTVVTRLAMDRLRAAKTERRAYVGPWLPEPWMQGAREEDAPDARSDRQSELSYAALVLLDHLEAEERAAFLLREVFAVDYGVVAAALERNEAACRQLVHRARERVFEGKPRRRSTAPEREDNFRRSES